MSLMFSRGINIENLALEFCRFFAVFHPHSFVMFDQFMVFLYVGGPLFLVVYLLEDLAKILDLFVEVKGLL